MEVRGRRRCSDCGSRWSYFETGSPACPSCGSLRSVAVEDEPTLHTDAPASLDLSGARSALEEGPLAEVARAAAEAAGEYLRARGFVRGGELLPLDDTVLAAAELRHVARRLERALDVDEVQERHFLDLLAGAESGERPGDLPSSLRGARGLAAVDAVSAYRRDLSTWLDRHADPAVRRPLERLRDHEKRVSALDGEVPPGDADALVAAARRLGEYLRHGDEGDLALAGERLDSLE